MCPWQNCGSSLFERDLTLLHVHVHLQVVRTFKSPIAALPGLTLRAAPHVLCLTG